MKPIPFPEQSCIYAEHQQEYLPLPAHRTADGIATACWSMSWYERLRVLLFGRIWMSIITFNHPIQPQLLSVGKPDFVRNLK